MPSKGTKRITPAIYNQVRTSIVKNGFDPTVQEFGYSLRTIRTIAHSQDYVSWRDARRRDNKATQTPETPPVSIKKPGHGSQIGPTPAQAKTATHDIGGLEAQVSSHHVRIATLERLVRRRDSEDAALSITEADRRSRPGLLRRIAKRLGR
ncbi:hypothetical protein GCM10009648_43940 [Tsukamurella spumae]